MAESTKGDIFHLRGRRVGPDAIVSRDEQWAARSREANPPAKEWVYSTFPFFAPNALEPQGSLGTFFNICIMPPISSTLHAVTARLKVYTGVANEELRVCLYRYARERDSTKKRRRLIKVLNSETVFDCTNNSRATPNDVSLGGDGAKVLPSEPFFLGWKASHANLRIPAAVVGNINHWPVYSQSYNDGVSFPNDVNLEDMSKSYDGNVPWVSFLSKEASILL